MNRKTKFGRLLRNEQGTSLVEALMAVALLSFGVLAVGGMTGVVMDKNNDSQKTTIAATLAQDKIEYFKNIARNVALSGADGLASPDLVASVWTADANGETIDAEGNAAASGSVYTRTWTITPVTGKFFLYDLSVTLTWQDGGTQTQQIDTQISQ